MDTITLTTDTLADQLAAACGAGDLAAAAAIDAEEGDRFLHARLADQMAGAHVLTMRMAALADRAISAAADGSGQGPANLPLFDLAAARFAGAAARLNGRYCRALQTLNILSSSTDEEDEVEWVGIATEPDTLSPEERARRINRMKTYRKIQARGKPNRKPGPRRRRIDAAEQASLVAAEHAARDLLTETGLDALASPSNTERTTLFTHQLAAAHRLTMRLTGRADVVVAAAVDPLDRPEGLRLAHGAARLMERFRQGVAMLHRLRTAPDRPRRVDYYSTDPYSDYEIEEERARDIAHGIDPDTGLPVSPPAASSTGTRPPASVLLRRGRLNNGNPGGDFLAAPRCGARTRAGCACRQPAMANGRCRFHGGKSTGPRTETGRARARSNRLVHGLRSAEIIALSAAAAAAHRSLGILLAAASSRKIHHREHREHREGRSTARGTRIHPSSVPSVSSVVNPSSLATASRLVNRAPAGHGVDRSESNAAVGDAVVLPFAWPTSHASARARVKGARSPHRNRIPRVGS
jgi:hypothetical protein